MFTKYRILRLYFFFFILIPLCSYSQYKKSHWNSRDQWQDAGEIMQLMSISKGMKVADIGCHEGYMTIHLSNFLGKEGKVYAVDIVEKRIKKLKSIIKEEKRTNVVPILGKPDNPLLPKNTLDAVIIMDTYHEIDAYKKVLKKVYQSLKKSGRLLILEEISTHRIKKSRKSQTDSHDIALRYVKQELIEAGFSISKEIPNYGVWDNDESTKIWVLVAFK